MLNYTFDVEESEFGYPTLYAHGNDAIPLVLLNPSTGFYRLVSNGIWAMGPETAAKFVYLLALANPTTPKALDWFAREYLPEHMDKVEVKQHA